jgi:hypothetical protein
MTARKLSKTQTPLPASSFVPGPQPVGPPVVPVFVPLLPHEAARVRSNIASRAIERPISIPHRTPPGAHVNGSLRWWGGDAAGRARHAGNETGCGWHNSWQSGASPAPQSRGESGRPGRFPSPAPHRSGRAELPHPALRVMGSLHVEGRAAGCAGAGAGSAPAAAASSAKASRRVASGGSATCATPRSLRGRSARSPRSSR